MRKTLAFTFGLIVFCASISGQEPRIFIPRTFQDPGGWFSVRVPADWEEKRESGLGRETFLFAPEADSEDAGKMDMSISFVMGWGLREVTKDILKAAAAEELQRLKDHAAKQGSTVVARETKEVILSRRQAILQVIDEAGKDGKYAVIHMFVLPAVVHTYIIQYRLPKEEDELASVQFERMVRSFSILSPKLTEIDPEKLVDYVDSVMNVTVKHPPSWQPKAEGEGDERRITLSSPEAEGAVVVVQKTSDAASRFKGEELAPEDIIAKYRDLYVASMAKTYGKVVPDPKSSLAPLGNQPGLACKLAFLADGQSRYALLVIGIQKGTLIQVFLSAPAEEFHHYAVVFGKILSTLKAF